MDSAHVTVMNTCFFHVIDFMLQCDGESLGKWFYVSPVLQNFIMLLVKNAQKFQQYQNDLNDWITMKFLFVTIVWE